MGLHPAFCDLLASVSDGTRFGDTLARYAASFRAELLGGAFLASDLDQLAQWGAEFAAHPEVDYWLQSPSSDGAPALLAMGVTPEAAQRFATQPRAGLAAAAGGWRSRCQPSRALGAGGGSIAEVVDGVLRVGPQSAGALPGPACFGLGGKRADGDAPRAKNVPQGRLLQRQAGYFIWRKCQVVLDGHATGHV